MIPNSIDRLPIHRAESWKSFAGPVGKAGFRSYFRQRGLRLARAPVRLPASIRWSLLLFAFSLPFESIDLLGTGSLSLARIAAVLVLGACLIYPKSAFSKPHAAYWCFGAYLVVFCIRGELLYGQFYGSPFFSELLMRLQLVIFAWLITKPLKDRKTALRTFLAFWIACVIVSASMILQIPAFTEIAEDNRGVERIGALGNDLNYLGTTLALGMVIAVGLFLGRELLALRSRIFVAAVSLVLPVGLLLTASRTAILSLIAGIALYLAPVGSLKSLLSRFGMALCCLVILVVMVLQNQQTASRLLSAYTEHNLSGRSSIVADSIEMFAEKPLWGWGPVEWWEELGTDTHNLFLYLLLEVGILGMIPYLAALFLCLRSLWRSRQSEWGKLCFAAFSTIMIANLGVNYRNFKPMWLLIAAALSLTIQSSRSRLAGLSLRSSTMPRSSDGGI